MHDKGITCEERDRYAIIGNTRNIGGVCCSKQGKYNSKLVETKGTEGGMTYLCNVLVWSQWMDIEWRELLIFQCVSHRKNRGSTLERKEKTTTCIQLVIATTAAFLPTIILKAKKSHMTLSILYLPSPANHQISWFSSKTHTC